MSWFKTQIPPNSSSHSDSWRTDRTNDFISAETTIRSLFSLDNTTGCFSSSVQHQKWNEVVRWNCTCFNVDKKRNTKVDPWSHFYCLTSPSTVTMFDPFHTCRLIHFMLFLQDVYWKMKDEVRFRVGFLSSESDQKKKDDPDLSWIRFMNMVQRLLYWKQPLIRYCIRSFSTFCESCPRSGAILCSATDKNQILLVRSKRSGKWTLPMGKLNPGENLYQCAVREVFEETGFLITDFKRSFLLFNPSDSSVYASFSSSSSTVHRNDEKKTAQHGGGKKRFQYRPFVRCFLIVENVCPSLEFRCHSRYEVVEYKWQNWQTITALEYPLMRDLLPTLKNVLV